MNSFCRYCEGDKVEDGLTPDDRIKECEDTSCPFYPFRQADMTWQEEKAKAEELLRWVGVKR